MKKVLFVLGFALCATMAFAQTANNRHEMPRGEEKTYRVKDLMKQQPVDYKASIFSKTGEFDTNYIFRFNATEWPQITKGYIQASDHIYANGHDSVFGTANANAVNVTAHAWCQWRRFADSTTFLNTVDSIYNNNFSFNASSVISYLGATNNENDPGYLDDGLVVFNYEEQNSGMVNAYMEFPEVVRDAQYVGKMVFVGVNQYYAKYYDQCFIDYWYNGMWHAREINVTGVDVDINYLAASKARYVMPFQLHEATNIKIRVRVSAPTRNVRYYGYGWVLDNVAIITSNLTETWDFSYTAPVEGFYGMIPRNMTLPVTYGTHVRNTNVTSFNNANLTLSAGPLNGEQPLVLTSNNFSIPAGDVEQDYKMFIDERGFAYGGDTMFNTGLVSWLGMHPNYGNTTGNLIGNYQGRSLPTGTVGANVYKIYANAGSLHTRVDSVLYTVSNNLIFPDGSDVNGYRWGRDNGLIPSNSSFRVAFNDDGYVTNTDEDDHTSAEGYVVHMNYVTGNEIPEGWVLKGIEYVPATDGTVSTGEGIIYPYIRKESYTEDGESVSWTSIATGIDGLAFDVTDDDIENLPMTGYILPPTTNVANYSAVSIFFPNQPELEPNTGYRFGYILNGNFNFHVASQATSYKLDAEHTASYSYTEETAPYRRQNTPLPTYQIYVEDPLAPEGTNGYVTAWNIDYFPMIRPIIGPREDVATDLFIADCSTNTEDSAFSVVINSEEMCGSEGVNLAVGGNYNFTISAAEDHTVLDNIYVNGVQAQIYDPNDPDHATPPEDPFYLSFYNTENNNDNVTVVVDAQGTEEVVLYRGYYVLHFYDLAEVAAPYVISATFHTEEWIHVGIDPVAPEAVLSLYPNPATSTVKLNINGVSGMVDCSIIDMSGRVVYNARVNAETENTIDVSNMPAGAYFVRVTNNTFSKIEKLIIK